MYLYALSFVLGLVGPVPTPADEGDSCVWAVVNPEVKKNQVRYITVLPKNPLSKGYRGDNR